MSQRALDVLAWNDPTVNREFFHYLVANLLNTSYPIMDNYIRYAVVRLLDCHLQLKQNQVGHNHLVSQYMMVFRRITSALKALSLGLRLAGQLSVIRRSHKKNQKLLSEGSFRSAQLLQKSKEVKAGRCMMAKGQNVALHTNNTPLLLPNLQSSLIHTYT